jgi:hypothetical protein
LIQMGARWYDAQLGRWISADSIVPEPGNPQSFNRYSYVNNNPLKYTDPTGHFSEKEIMGFFGVETWEEVLAFFEEGGSLEGRWGWLEVLRQAETTDNLYGSSKGCRPGRGLQALPEGANSEEWESIGHFWISDGRLMVGLLSGKSVEHQEIATTFNYYQLKHYPLGFGPKEKFRTTCYQKYSHTRFDTSEVDKLGATLDIVGIVTNFIPDPTAQAAGLTADFISIGFSGAEFNIAWVSGAPAPEILDKGVDLALDLGGLVPGGGIVPDVLSLGKNYAQNTRLVVSP